MRIFYDNEEEEYLTEEQLEEEYKTFGDELSSGAKTFEDYIDNCLSKNGSLKEVTDDVEQCVWCEEYFDKSELCKEINLGYLCDRCKAAIWSRGEKLTIEEM